MLLSPHISNFDLWYCYQKDERATLETFERSNVFAPTPDTKLLSVLCVFPRLLTLLKLSLLSLSLLVYIALRETKNPECQS
jgi:hypothetical protein